MKKYLRNKWVVFSALLILGVTTYAYAQERRGWRGHMFFDINSPQIRFDGTLSFQDKSSGTTKFAITQNSNVAQLRAYRASLTPVSFSNWQPLFTNLFTTQSFSVSGLTASDVVMIAAPTTTTACGAVGASIPSTDTLVVRFLYATTGACTPPAGIYQVFTVRT